MRRIFIFLCVLFSVPAILSAAEVNEVEHAKVVTLDATPTDPGQVEEDLTYSILGGKFAWQHNGGRRNRGTYLTQNWDTETYVGLFKNVDVIISQGFQHILDKENNVNEFKGMSDPAVLRQAGLFAVWTPDELVARAATMPDLSTFGFQPLLGGLDPAQGWKSLELLGKALPRLKAALAQIP